MSEQYFWTAKSFRPKVPFLIPDYCRWTRVDVIRAYDKEHALGSWEHDSKLGLVKAVKVKLVEVKP